MFWNSRQPHRISIYQSGRLLNNAEIFLNEAGAIHIKVKHTRQASLECNHANVKNKLQKETDLYLMILELGQVKEL
jgi:hypothetical protein